MKETLTDLDYVSIYANKLKENPDLFKQHAELIDSQIKASKEIFKKKFGTRNFNENARKYLRAIQLIK